MSSNSNNFDIIIIGAGLSGIGAAHHIQDEFPNKTYAILEARENLGGTWDLFKYPGIRSDSDMYTLGYSFKPWKNAKAIADGPDILNYIQETAEESGIIEHIHFNNKIIKASWDSNEAIWTLETENKSSFSCNFLISCTGYFNYESGFTPHFEGREKFKGEIIHPQHWDTSLNYEDKKIVVIGSGATAVTLVPELAKKASHVTMLQRSPSYILTMPSKDIVANTFRKILPSKMAYWLTRWKNISMSVFFYNACMRWPQLLKKILMKGVKKELGNSVDVETHFNPKYNPWKQRLCLVPDSNLFSALQEDHVDIVTDHIDHFTETGIKLNSGNELETDIIITATGLNILILGGIEAWIDGKKINPSNLICYRGMMFDKIPNFVVVVGYTNASWTLKCDLTSKYICRLIKHMDNTGSNICYAEPIEKMELEPLLDFDAGYVLRSLNEIPKQGSKYPWKLYMNYFYDMFNFKYSSLNDKNLKFKK